MFRRARPRLGHRAGGLAHIVVGAGAALVACLVAVACGASRGLVLSPIDGGEADVVVSDVARVTPIAPITIGLTGQDASAEHGGDTGTASVDTCPADQAVIGYRGFLVTAEIGAEPEPFVGGITTLCGALAATGDPPAPVTVVAGATLATRGEGRDSPWEEACPPDQVVVGFAGSAGAAFDRIAIACAPLVVVRDLATGALTVSIGATTTSPENGGAGGSPFQDACPAGEIARGSGVRSGSWVDAFGLVCGAPTATTP